MPKWCAWLIYFYNSVCVNNLISICTIIGFFPGVVTAKFDCEMSKLMLQFFLISVLHFVSCFNISYLVRNVLQVYIPNFLIFIFLYANSYSPYFLQSFCLVLHVCLLLNYDDFLFLYFAGFLIVRYQRFSLSITHSFCVSVLKYYLFRVL